MQGAPFVCIVIACVLFAIGGVAGYREAAPPYRYPSFLNAGLFFFALSFALK